MSWHIPSLSSLRAFEASARHLSFTKAAAELHLTQSAVSKQISLMEESLGLLLFQRVRQRLVLTDAGQQYAEAVRSALDQIQEATVTLLAHKGRGGALRIATAPAFATKWLIPRLAHFNKAYPGIVINLSTRDLPFDMERDEFDAAFHYGSNDWANVLSESLVGHDLVAVCSPAYLEQHPPINAPADLREHVLLQQTRRPRKWREWFDAMGVSDIDSAAGPRFEHFYMIAQAAIAHLGIGLVPRLLVEDDIANGRLVVPLPKPFYSGDSYCLVYPPSKRNDPKLEQFRRWLISEAEAGKEGRAPPSARKA
ncbi:MAG: transcriptional regulator GcvA [Burkholderiaceae bacterium]